LQKIYSFEHIRFKFIQWNLLKNSFKNREFGYTPYQNSVLCNLVILNLYFYRELLDLLLFYAILVKTIYSYWRLAVFFQVFSTLLRINSTLLIYILIFCVAIFLYSYFTTTKHQKKLYSKEITIIPDLLKWLFILVLYSVFMYSLIDIEINQEKNQSDKINLIRNWVGIPAAIAVFLTTVSLEIDAKRFKGKNNFILFVLKKWVRIGLCMTSIVLVALSYGVITNSIMYSFSISNNIRLSSTLGYLFEFNNLSISFFFISILIILGLPAVYLTNRFWSFIMETLIPEKEVVDIRLANGNIIRNVYLYKSPIGKYIYVGNNKQHASATQIVAVNKKDIETILFKKEYENYHEKNQIIIQKRKR
jgi:hypothetical protein